MPDNVLASGALSLRLPAPFSLHPLTPSPRPRRKARFHVLGVDGPSPTRTHSSSSSLLTGPPPATRRRDGRCCGVVAQLALAVIMIHLTVAVGTVWWMTQFHHRVSSHEPFLPPLDDLTQRGEAEAVASGARGPDSPLLHLHHHVRHSQQHESFIQAVSLTNHTSSLPFDALKKGAPPSSKTQRVKLLVDPGPTSRADGLIAAARHQVPLFARDGTYHVHMQVGQPPQFRRLIVDTGSTLTAWTCRHQDLTHERLELDLPQQPSLQHQQNQSLPDPSTLASSLYDPAISTTVHVLSCHECHFEASSCSSRPYQRFGLLPDAMKNSSAITDHHKVIISPCTVEQRYTEGSRWTALEMADQLTFLPAMAQPGRRLRGQQSIPIPPVKSFVFGCQTAVEGLFRRQFADGILGLEWSEHSLLQAMHQQQLVDQPTFSLCLCPSSPAGGSPTKGWMGLGGNLPHLHVQPMRTTPIMTTSSRGGSANQGLMYAVHVQEVWLGPVCLARPDRPSDAPLLAAFGQGKGTILDSGTTDTYLPRALADVFKRAWLQVTGRPYLPRQARYTRHQVATQLPSLTLRLANHVNLTIPPLSYMELVEEEEEEADEPEEESAADEKSSLGGEAPMIDQEPPRRWANRLYVNEPVGAVLGINALVNHDIWFDGASGWVGIAPADCCRPG